MKKKILALVLAAVLVFSTMPAFASSYVNNRLSELEGSADNPLVVSSGLDGFQYVNLGDSISYGYGLGGFEPIADVSKWKPPLYLKEGCFPDIIQQYLGCGEADFVQGAFCGIRAVDLCTILCELTDSDKYPADEYYDEYITLQIGNMKGNGIDKDYYETVKAAIEKADFISLSVGGNDLFNYLTRYLLGEVNNIPQGNDWERYYNKATVASYNAIKNILIKQATEKGDEDTIKMEDLFKKIELVLYSVGGYLRCEEDILDMLHKMNPSAVIAITGLPGVYSDFDVQVGSIVVDMEKVLAPMCVAANNVIKNSAEERGTYCRYIDITDMEHFKVEKYDNEGILLVDDNNVVKYENLMTFLFANTIAVSHPSGVGHLQIAEKVVSNFEFKTSGSKLTTVKNILTNLWPAILSRLGVAKVQNFLDIFKQINLWGVVKLSISK